MISEKYMTATEAAKKLGLTTGHIRQLCIDGKFPDAEKMGKTWIVPKESVDNYVPPPKGFAAVWKKRRDKEAALQTDIKQAIAKKKK